MITVFWVLVPPFKLLCVAAFWSEMTRAKRVVAAVTLSLLTAVSVFVVTAQEDIAYQHGYRDALREQLEEGP